MLLLIAPNKLLKKRFWDTINRPSKEHLKNVHFYEGKNYEVEVKKISYISYKEH